jgi:hypothetical protein
MPKYLCNSDNNLCKFLGDRPLECIGSCLNKEKCEHKITLDQYDKAYLLDIICNKMGLRQVNDYYYLKTQYHDEICLGRIPVDKLLSSILLTIYESGYNKGKERGENSIKAEIRDILGIQNKDND